MIAWMNSKRVRLSPLDAAIAAVGVGASIPYMISEVGDDKIHASAGSVAPFALIMVPLLWRRRQPLGALTAVLLLLLLHVAIFGGVVRCGIVLPAVFVMAYAAGARLDGRAAAIGLALAGAVGVAICLTDGPGNQGAPPEALIFVAPITAAVWGVGRAVRSRSKLVGTLRARTVELESARTARTRLQVATERQRLSTELETLIRRRMSELTKLAEGHADAWGEDAVSTLAEIETRSRATLDEMRSVVGALREDGVEAPLAPQPTLTELEALLLRAKGSNARLCVEGNPRVLPAAVELSAYRIVEQLLDALAEAPDIEVRVRFADAALQLEVSGPVRRRADQALERARERVALHAGSLSTTVRGGRTQAVVSLPLLAPV